MLVQGNTDDPAALSMRRRLNSARLPSAEAATRRPPSKGSHVYEDIKEAILCGRLEPGSSIDKSALCERLGMSRFPVTAAISRLAYERLVVVQPQHGSFVAKIALGDVREVMMIRRAIEGDLAARAAEDLPGGLLARLDDNLRDQAAALADRDRDRFFALDLQFHEAILGPVAQSHTGAVLASMRAHLERVRRLLTSPPGRMRATFEEHGAVNAAIAARDPDGARRAMRGHLVQTTRVIDDFARQNPSLFSDQP